MESLFRNERLPLSYWFFSGDSLWCRYGKKFWCKIIGIVIVLIVLIVITVVIIIHANNKHSAWYFCRSYNVNKPAL